MARLRHGNPLRNAPNLLTLLRICVTPFLVLAIVERHFGLAFGLFVAAACTDAMDGLLARWLRQRTMLGQYLDPVADKLLLSSLFLVLTFAGILDPRITVVVFGRDLGMMLVATILYAISDLRDFRPTLLGKANSLCQLLAIGVVLLSLIHPEAWVFAASNTMLSASVLLTVISGFHYAVVVSRRIGDASDLATAVAEGKSGIQRTER